MATKRNAMTDKAGTNPYQNIGQQPVRQLNANTDYNIFEYEYFKDILLEKEEQTNLNNSQQNISQQQNNSQTQNKQKENPDGAPVNSSSLAYRKKQVMCEIIKDCFNAKLSALGLLYRDFIYLMDQHVNSYKQTSKNNQQNIQQSNQKQEQNIQQSNPN